MYRGVKRALDFVTALLALIVLSPLLAITALAVKLDSKGPAIFKQQRLGLHGKTFWIYKFRSMCQGAEHTGTGVYSGADDMRVTRVGKLLRATSIDELPQLWDVFCGHMSIIGPRPPLPREVVLYTPHQMQRLQVKGGLSCICQVEGRSDMGFEKWVESDLEYIQTRSAGLDLKLVFKTIGVVIMKKGAR